MASKMHEFWQTDVVKAWTGKPTPANAEGPAQGLALAEPEVGEQPGEVEDEGPGDYIEPAKKIIEGLEKGWDWINEQGETKIIIKNQTSKDMKFVSGTGELKKKGQAIFTREPPPRIAAGKDDHIIVQTDMTFRGKTRAETSGSAMYKIDAKDERVRASNLHLVWVRKGDRGLAMVDSAATDTLLGYELEGHQSGKGEFTFFVREIPVANPPQPQTDGSKDSKSPPPADIFVLFDVDKSDLTSEARSDLHKFANAYRAAKSTAEITVEGWASIEGELDRNKRLSYQRAEAVFKYLSNKDDGNLPKDKIEWEGKKTTSGFGKDKKDLPPNRRATISLKGAKGPAETPPDTKKEPQSPVDPKTKVPAKTKVPFQDKDEPPAVPRRPHAVGNPH